MRIKTSSRIALTVLTLVAGIGITLSIVALPSIRGIRHLFGAIEEERMRIENTVNRALKLRQTSEDIAGVTTGLPQLETMIIAAGKEVEFFTVLEKKSRTYRLAETLRIGESAPGPGDIRKLPLDIEFRGSFLDVLRFLVDLEQSATLLPLNQISLRLLGEAGASTADFTAIMKGTLYVASIP